MKVFWFDTETSGTDPQLHGIITLAYVIEIDGEEVESGELRANPTLIGKQVDPKALEVNKLSLAEIADYPNPKEMYNDLCRVLNRYVDKFERSDKFTAAGYNVGFDVDFLRDLWTQCGDPYFGAWFAFGHIDPAQIIRFLQYTGNVPFFAAGKLTDLARHFGIETQGAHDSLADIRMTREIVRAVNDVHLHGRTPNGRGEMV